MEKPSYTVGRRISSNMSKHTKNMNHTSVPKPVFTMCTCMWECTWKSWSGALHSRRMICTGGLDPKLAPPVDRRVTDMLQKGCKRNEGCFQSVTACKDADDDLKQSGHCKYKCETLHQECGTPLLHGDSSKWTTKNRSLWQPYLQRGIQHIACT